MATPGHHTLVHGGNTTCYEMRAGATTMVFDAGTGLIGLARALTERGTREIALFITHWHWDHVLGLPFFPLLARDDVTITIYSRIRGHRDPRAMIHALVDPPHFPMGHEGILARLDFVSLGDEPISLPGGVTVTPRELRHPGGATGFRVASQGASVAFVTDHEAGSELVDARVETLAEGADLFIMDSMYTPEHYRGDEGISHVGWGHSTFESACALARRCGVGKLLLHHHNPEYDDATIDDVVQRARALFAETDAAKEGETYSL